MKTYLKNRITSGKVGNIARQLTEQQCAEIEEYTNFLVDPKSFNERIFCYAMNITEQPRDIFGRPARFINIKKGYSYCVDQGIKILKGDINKLKKRHKQITKSITSNLNTVSPGLQEYRDRQKRIKVFSKRNSLVNKDLYSKESVENIDYRVCPVSKQRMSMIGANYIENTLKMTVEEYDRLYPGVRGSSLRRSQNIRKAIHTVDSVTGKTRYQISQEKARNILSEVDEYGVSGYKKKGQKTRATHMRNIDEYGRNGYRRQADYRLTTVLSNGLTVEENAHIKQKNTLIKNKKTCNAGASKQSIRALKDLLDYLDFQKITYYFNKNEYCIKDKVTGNYYFYDLTIPKYNMVIEYQSNAWHANPWMSDEEWSVWDTPRGKKITASESLNYDYTKAKALYENRGFYMYFVWEKTQQADVEEIICLLKTMTTKS